VEPAKYVAGAGRKAAKASKMVEAAKPAAKRAKPVTRKVAAKPVTRKVATRPGMRRAKKKRA
jgi:hypothetical protein